MGLINITDRGEIKYPKLCFGMLLLTIEIVLKLVLAEYEDAPNLSLKLRKIIVPHLSLNPLIPRIGPAFPHNTNLYNEF